MSNIQKITIKVGDEKSVYTLQGNKAHKLEAVLGLFEDVLATHFGLDHLTESLDIVDAVALND